ncbi:MAG: outer membrane protein assembly factor BamD [Magnetococcales bacterium]|nr:outer membrane protein assembly factor BamD [Magnetococcales bacterium]NGZ27302.1 outer membrane protein assembly factor BamD [Magnetococcales bacterium]
MKKALFPLVLILTLAGCSSTPDLPPEDKRPPEVIYMEGVEMLRAERFKTAAKLFEGLDQKHPFSPWATRSQINLIYSTFKQDQFEEAISNAERFIRLHPRHPHVAYAYYMRALAFYQQIADPYRDQGKTREAIAAFRELVKRFPNSDYAFDAKQMLTLCMYRLAEQEMVIGRYYLDQREFIAASNRFRRVVEDKEFSTTFYVEEALFGLAYAHYRLGLLNEARNYASVLGHNFRDGGFYALALDALDGRTIGDGEIASLRRHVEEESLFKRFFQGLTPGLPGMERLGKQE